MDVCLSACKSISLDGNYFIVIFMVKIARKWNLAGFKLTPKTGKNYLIETVNDTKLLL